MRRNAIRRTDRIEKIIATLREQANASFKYLASELEVSEVTIRRDIAYMTSRDEYRFVQRTPGGIVLLDGKLGLEYMFDLKLSINKEAKDAIAAKALDFLDDGDSIVLDSGTTCMHLSKLLHRRNGLRVLTTDIKIAEELGGYANINSYVICGEIRPGYYTIGGEVAVEALGKFQFEKAVFSADAIDLRQGITNITMFEVGIKRRIVEKSKRRILLADSSKFGKVAMFHVLDLSAVNVLITDRGLNPELIDQIKNIGIELVLA